MGKILTNDNQLQERADASEGIAKDFGIEKALGYLLGEKFYNLVATGPTPIFRNQQKGFQKAVTL
jgi:hypothetical protein